MVKPLTLALLIVAAGPAGAQEENRLVERNAAARQIALGYPVPRPVESLTPVAGFRSYASLHARQQDLALRSPDLQATVVGQTTKGRAIWAYILGSFEGKTVSGAIAPGMLINSTIHAREWQTPEVSTGIIERFMDGADDSGLVRFLLDEMRTVVIPVHNIDGFLMTQAQPDRVYVGSDVTDPTWPREGRMRRKNLRAADEVFESLGDHLQGIDLNRNFLPFFASNNSSSNDSRSLVYRGPTPASEPESIALINSASLIATNKLRLFGDLHSFSRVLFSVRTGDSRADAQTALIASRFASHDLAISPLPNARFYVDTPNAPNTGIGTTSEYFAHTYAIPAWTLELEPGETGASEYGGFGWHHDGFVLPASEITRLRSTMAENHLLLAYHVAGPAILKSARIYERDSGALVASGEWLANGRQARTYQSRGFAALRSAGRYRLQLVFDRPMRVLDGAGNAALFPGQSGPLDPTVIAQPGNGAPAASLSNGQWRHRSGAAVGETFERYRGDVWSADLTLPEFTGGSPSLSLSVDTVDAIGRRLDANPATVVDWLNGAWSMYEGSTGVAGDVGGADTRQNFAALAGLWLGADSAQRIAEGETATLRIARPQGAAGVTLDLSYSEGLSGPATLLMGGGEASLQLRLLDDLVVNSALAFRNLQVRITEPGQAPVTAQLEAFDNDTSQLRTVVAGSSEELIAALDPAAAASPRRIVLIPGQTYALGGDLPEVHGRVLIEGHQAALRRIDAAGPGRLLSVAADGDLQLRELLLLGAGGPLLDGGQLLNRGRLSLDRVHSLSAIGRCGAAIWSDGQLSVQRSYFVDARGQSAGVFCIAGGTADIASSTITDARADSAAVIANRGQSTLRNLTLDANRSTAGPLLQSSEGTLSLGASVAGGSPDLLCSSTVQSAGDNLLSPAGCVGGSADFVTSDTVLQPDPAHPGLRIVAAGPWDQRNTQVCAGVDQLGLPRPQGARCEAGARERGIVPSAGFWWSMERSGQGLDIKRAGDGLLVLLYTYDTDGRPITYTAQAAYQGNTWTAPVLRWRQAPVSLLPESTSTGELQLQFSDEKHALMRLSLNGAAVAEYPIESFPFGDQSVAAVERTYSGAARYGLSYARHGAVQFGLLYAYDADQVLRWASAQDSNDSGALQLYTFSGSCPSCAYQPPRGLLSGKLRLRGAGLELAEADIELRFGVGAGGSLFKSGALLERLDAP